MVNKEKRTTRFYQYLPFAHGIILSLLVLLMLVAAHVPAQARYDSLFHQSYAVRSGYFDEVIGDYLFRQPSATQMRILTELQDRAKKEDDYPAELEVLIGKIIFTPEYSMAEVDHKIAISEQFLQELNPKKYPEYAAVVMFHLGNMYYGRKHNYTLAFEHFINAYNIARQFSQRDFPDKKTILVGLGNRYYTMGDYDRAKKVLLEADTLVRRWDKLSTYNCQNTLGLVYRTYGQYDTAIYYFERAKQLAQEDGDKVWAAIAAGNIGISYYKQGLYDRAIPLLEEDVKYSFTPNSFAVDNGINSLLILTDIHLRRNELDKVAENIHLTRQYLDSCRDQIKPLGMLFPILARYHFRLGDYKTAYLFLDTAIAYKDTLFERDNIYKLAKVAHRKDIEKAGIQIKRLRAEKQVLSLTRNGLLAGFLLLLIITLLIINRQRLKHHLKQNAILARQKQAESDLQAASRQLDSFMKHLQEKTLLIEQSGQEIERLRTRLAANDAEQENGEVLRQLYNSTILTDDEWNDFKALFEQVHKGYLQRLKNKMTELTPADTRFMVLSKLNLSNKEMAGILGVQADTIRTYKHRLRKRFGLPEDASIKDFVDSI